MNYHNITTCDMLNGEGLRVVLWLAHCEHNCVGCHNRSTHAADSGILFDQHAYEDILKEMDQEYISGITFSGGDPLSMRNRMEVLEMAGVLRARFPTKTIWLYTGYVWEAICQLPGIEHFDVIVDGLFEVALLDCALPYRGSRNQRVIDVKCSLLEGCVVEKY